MRTLSIFAFSILLSIGAFAQSKTVANFEKNAEGYKLFLYQSVLRVMNQDKDPDFNMLIRDLDHLRFVTTDSVGMSAKQVFSDLDQGVRGEGYEEIMSFDNKDYRAHVFEKSARSQKTSWVVTLYMDGRAGIIEMKGSLNMKYIGALAKLNMERVKELLPVDVNNWK